MSDSGLVIIIITAYLLTTFQQFFLYTRRMYIGYNILIYFFNVYIFKSVNIIISSSSIITYVSIITAIIIIIIIIIIFNVYIFKSVNIIISSSIITYVSIKQKNCSIKLLLLLFFS